MHVEFPGCKFEPMRNLVHVCLFFCEDRPVNSWPVSCWTKQSLPKQLFWVVGSSPPSKLVRIFQGIWCGIFPTSHANCWWRPSDHKRQQGQPNEHVLPQPVSQPGHRLQKETHPGDIILFKSLEPTLGWLGWPRGSWELPGFIKVAALRNKCFFAGLRNQWFNKHLIRPAISGDLAAQLDDKWHSLWQRMF